MTEVDDVLIGDKTVLVKTDENTYEFDRDGEQVKSNRSDLPMSVLESLQEEGFEVESDFPQEIQVYAHDEPTPYERKEVAEDLGLEEDSELASQIAHLTYEVDFTVEVHADGTWEVTHVFGHELKEPYSY